LLAVSKVDQVSAGFFKALVREPARAKVGIYSFSRQDNLFVGIGGGLVYLASDKALLMGYLGRLSGKAGPRLAASVAYAAPRKAVGDQELGLYLNFSASAKLIRGQFGKLFLPRLLSPVVDAIDTLGQYASGFSTTKTGLSAVSALAPNPAGKDTPLYSVLTHTTNFEVQNIIPASAEAVRATACAPETGVYQAAWLNRIDLFDPFGFLSDSQLSANLVNASRYLGDECAQVTLAGGTLASLDTTGTQALGYSVSYHKVSDMTAAEAHMPAYAAAVNRAIGGVADSLTSLNSGLLSRLGSQSEATRGAAASLDAQLAQFRKQLGAIKLVYGFRDGYLVSAYSDKALQTALKAAGPRLAEDAGFTAAELPLMDTAGWSYARQPAKTDPKAFEKAIRQALSQSGSDVSSLVSPEIIKAISGAILNLANRYGGMSSQSSALNGVIVSKANVRYAW
uniref:hypothetical protein n=1 Tax=Deinococcus sp. TaxID=47478 RepID=UPI0025E7C597